MRAAEIFLLVRGTGTIGYSGLAASLLSHAWTSYYRDHVSNPHSSRNLSRLASEIYEGS